MPPELAINISGLSKRFEIYEKPGDRLKQFLMPRLQRHFGRPQKQYFKEFWAVNDLSLQIVKGETFGIVGRNGSGKSTLLQMICGTLTPTVGHLETQGRIAALLELGSGFNPEFTGRENVHMNASVLGLSAEQIDQRFADIAAFADIGDFIEQPVKTYSSGMMLRLAFAVIAHVDADILVIDEALAVGDAYFAQKCMRFLRAFKQKGTLLFVSHDASAVVNLCDRALWLQSGRMMNQGMAKGVMELYLEGIYGGTPATATDEAAAPRARQPAAAVAEQIPPVVLTQRTLAMEPASSQGLHQGFGTGMASISDVRLLSASGESLRWVSGGEKVTLEINVRSVSRLDQPIIGFIVKDRLGQHLFGDNTFEAYASTPLSCPPDNTLRACFEFSMPLLPRGEYSMAVAIADGTQDHHVVHEWVHEALLFQSHCASVVTGLVGIPMLGVKLGVAHPHDAHVENNVT